MCREMIAVSQTKNNLSHFPGIAILLAPKGVQCLNYRANGRFIIGKQFRYVLVRTNAPVCPHPAGFERTHLDAKGCDFLGERLGESSDSPLGSVVRRAAGKGQATT